MIGAPDDAVAPPSPRRPARARRGGEQISCRDDGSGNLNLERVYLCVSKKAQVRRRCHGNRRDRLTDRPSS